MRVLIDSTIPVLVRIRYAAYPNVFDDFIIQPVACSEAILNFSTITVDVLRPLPVNGVAAMMLRAAWRVRPLLIVEEVEAVRVLDESLALADRVLQRRLPCDALNEPAETIYQLAASFAARSRVSGMLNHRRAAAAGAVLHCTIDGIADLDHDPQATLGCGILALRSCGKLEDSCLSNEIQRDIERLRSEAMMGQLDLDIMSKFGPLWGIKMPAWAQSE